MYNTIKSEYSINFSRKAARFAKIYGGNQSMKKFTLRTAIIMIAVIMAFVTAVPFFGATSSTTTTTKTNASTKDVSFEIETDVTKVRTKGIINVTVTMSNNSSKNIQELEFSLSFDSKRILGFTTDYSASINDVTMPNDKSPIVLRQQGDTVKIYNFDPSDSTFAHTPLSAGKNLKITFPMVVSESAELGDILFTVSDAKATDASGNSMSMGGYPNAKVTVVPEGDDATLSNIIVSVNDAPVTLTPEFSPEITSYSVTVSNTIPSIKFNVQCNDDRATFLTEKPNQLEVGNNTFKFIVTAEDKTTTKTYTVLVRRLAAGETTTSSTTTTSTTTTTSSTTESTTTTTTVFIPDTTAPTMPSSTAPVSSEPQKGEETSKVTLNLAGLLGIVAAAIALFLLAFSAGYITHKNAAQPQKYSVDELMAAQEKLEMQNRLAMQQNAGQYPDAMYQQYQPYSNAAQPQGFGANEYTGYDPATVASFEQPSLYPMTAGFDQNAYAGSVEEYNVDAQQDPAAMYGVQDMNAAPAENGMDYNQGDIYYQ